MVSSIERFTGDRNSLLSLYELADDSRTQIDSYIALGVVLVAREDNDVIGHIQLLETEAARVFEIRSIAVRASRQGAGVGRELVEAAIRMCREWHATSLIVSTAAADISNLRFYQRLGFRMHHIVRDAYVPLTGYAAGTMIDGIMLRDAVSFDCEII